jgi:hypothetical protein
MDQAGDLTAQRDVLGQVVQADRAPHRRRDLQPRHHQESDQRDRQDRGELRTDTKVPNADL